MDTWSSQAQTCWVIWLSFSADNILFFPIFHCFACKKKKIKIANFLKSVIKLHMLRIKFLKEGSLDKNKLGICIIVSISFFNSSNLLVGGIGNQIASFGIMRRVHVAKFFEIFYFIASKLVRNREISFLFLFLFIFCHSFSNQKWRTTKT